MSEIRYDLEAVDTEFELLRQVCLRLDRHFPSDQSDAAKANAVASMNEELETLSNSLRSLGLAEMADKLMDLIA